MTDSYSHHDHEAVAEQVMGRTVTVTGPHTLQTVNLATWEGTDGNGYYGTGYSIIVRRPA